MAFAASGSGNSLAQADAARDAKDWAPAETFYAKFLKTHRDRHDIWIQLGHALKEQGKLTEAEKSYRTSLDVRPTADGFLQLGHVLKLLGFAGRAKASYLHAALLDDTDSASVTEELQGSDWSWDAVQLWTALNSPEAPPRFFEFLVLDLLDKQQVTLARIESALAWLHREAASATADRVQARPVEPEELARSLHSIHHNLLFVMSSLAYAREEQT